MASFVIGDVHGCVKTLEKLLFSVCKITPDDTVYLLGDYIDRGPWIRETVEFIIDLRKSHNVKAIRGNHEQMMMNAFNSKLNLKQWFRNGGKETLDSFEVLHPGYMEDKFLDFFYGLPFYIELKDFFIVHAGFNFNDSNPLTDYFSMLWMRSDDYIGERIKYKKIIVGHTPTSLDNIKNSLTAHKIMLDGGCVYQGRVRGLGYLPALELDSMELLWKRNIDYDD